MLFEVISPNHGCKPGRKDFRTVLDVRKKEMFLSVILAKLQA